MPRYFVKLYKRRRWMFILVAVFCIGQAFFMIKGVETVPFFLYGMYSEPLEPTDRYSGLLIEEDGQALDVSGLPGLRKDLIYTPLYRFAFLEANNWEDPIKPVVHNRFEGRLSPDTYFTVRDRLSNAPVDRDRFAQWFRAFLELQLGRKLGVIRVYQTGIQYQPNAIQVVDKQLLLEA